MRGFILATLSLFSLGAVAAPAAACMTKKDASRVAGNFRALIHDTFNTTLAKTAMTTDFTDYSDSVNELINNGCPNGPATLGTPTFTSRKAFIAGQSGQPPIGFRILNLWNTCDTVIIRWKSPAPGTVDPEQQVTGIIVIETKQNVQAKPIEPFLIQTVYSEFNSGAWLYDLGIFVPSNCTTTTKRSISHPRML